MVKVLKNEEHKGIEIYFDNIPNKDIMQKLKELKFRWHRLKKCWFNKANTENEQFALSLANTKEIQSLVKDNNTTQKRIEQQDEEEQKKLKEEYFTMLFAESWQDKKMQDYFRKKIARVIKLENDNFIAIEKENIQTSFCFGYSLSRYDSKDYDNANDMVNYAYTNEQYFINENLQIFDRKLEDLKNYNLFLIRNYNNAPKDSKCKALVFKSDWQVMNFSEQDKDELTPVSEQDKQKIIKAYEIERDNFEKRVKTYLKKYGLSKIRAWSYWQDA